MSEKKKAVLKEKFVSIYETFFKVSRIGINLFKYLQIKTNFNKQAEDFSAKPANFWDELFLLKVKKTVFIDISDLPSY